MGGGGGAGGVRARGVSGDYVPLTSRFHLKRKMERHVGSGRCWSRSAGAVSSRLADEIIYLYNLLNFYGKFFHFLKVLLLLFI